MSLSFTHRLASPCDVPASTREALKAQQASGPDATPRCERCGWRTTLDHVPLFHYCFCPRCGQGFAATQGEGRYRFEGVLSDGPDTRLFLATDTRLDRAVSVLYYKPSEPGAPQLAVPPDLRAKHEALTLAKLVHPGIARIHLIEEAQCRPALVVESLLGTLAQPIAFGMTAHIQAALTLLWRLADALRFAAESGHCHHRLLPDHIGLTPDHQPKLLGFGHQRPANFMPGLRPVEAAFLAPEIRVLHPDADERADIFSLGILAYAILAGRYPVVPRRRGSVSPITKFRPDVPPAFAALLRSMISHQAADRPAGYAELLQQLQAISPAPLVNAAA